MKKVTFYKVFLFLVFLNLVSPRNVYAYLDPGSAGFLTQIVVAGIAGGAYLIATSWKKIKSIFSSFFSKSDKKDVSQKDIS